VPADDQFDLDTAVDALYARPLDEFIAARDAAVRTDGLVRAVREAGEVGGRSVSSAVLDRMTETLTAAVMDPDAAAVVRAGRLSRALQHVGFGIVDEEGEEAELVELRPAKSEAGRSKDAGGSEDEGRPRAAGRSKPKEAPATDKADSSEANLVAAEQAVEDTSARVDELEARRDEIRERLRAADEVIERGEGEIERLDQELERLTAERDAASEALDDARETADEAHTDLAALEDELDDAVERAAEARRRRRDARGR
jgi:hypothetical protein